MSKSRRFLIPLLLVTSVMGCSHFSTSVDTPPDINDYIPPPAETQFVFHKPRLGATFTMKAIDRTYGNITSDTTFVFTVSDTAATHDGKSGVLELDGYYRPFFVSYRTS